MIRCYLVISTLLLLSISYGQTPGSKKYFEQQPPTDVALLFAPGVISDEYANRDFAISPDGNEIFYTLQQKDLVSFILYSKRVNGRWSIPAIAAFSGMYNDLEPAFTSDGKRLFFSSNRKLEPLDSTKDFNIWYVEKENGKWSRTTALDKTVNSEKDEFYPSVTNNGDLYFTAQIESGKGREDIVVSEWKDGRYLPPVSLPEAINTKGFEFNAFVDPDGQYMIFTAYGRKDEFGKGDLYISLKKNGHWQPALNLGNKINGPTTDYCPFVSWDKQYLFFTASKAKYQAPFTNTQSIADLKKGLRSPANGFDDIYWIRFDQILSEIQSR